jgi:uncharacterized protein YyaL (SSP411 family)
MLYDQAQLAQVYAQAFLLSQDECCGETARDTLDYALRDLANPQGGFASAEDADSPGGQEGEYYRWDKSQLRQVLGDDASWIDPEDGILEAHGDLPAVRGRLLAARQTRPRPARDDKVLTAWNSLMISALVSGSEAFNEPRYLQAARATAQFIESKLTVESELSRRWVSGETAGRGQLSDYAFFIQALLDLYEAEGRFPDLDLALRLQEKQDQLFAAPGGGYFDSDGRDPSLPMRMRETQDGAVPAASSVAALNLARLGEMTGREEWKKKARLLTENVNPRAFDSSTALLTALDFLLVPPTQVVIAGDPGAADTRAMLAAVHARFMPHKIVLVADGVHPLAAAEGKEKRLPGGATAYVCHNYACRQPTCDLKKLAEFLR